MIKTILVCDGCHEGRDDLIHYIIPFPEEVTAYGGRGKPKKIMTSKFMGQKEVDLCPSCANKLFMRYYYREEEE